MNKFELIFVVLQPVNKRFRTLIDQGAGSHFKPKTFRQTNCTLPTRHHLEDRYSGELLGELNLA